MTYCWYIEGSSFHDGYATRQDAINAACADDADLTRLYVGTVSSPIDEMARLIDARDIADNLGESLNVEDAYVRVGSGAQAALEAWVREYLDFDASSVCLDGDKPTTGEWAIALASLGDDDARRMIEGGER